MPSNAYDAKGLLFAAVNDDNPVIFVEHKLLYKAKGPVPEEPYQVPLRRAGWFVKESMSPSWQHQSWSVDPYKLPTSWAKGDRTRGN